MSLNSHKNPIRQLLIMPRYTGKALRGSGTCSLLHSYKWESWRPNASSLITQTIALSHYTSLPPHLTKLSYLYFTLHSHKPLSVPQICCNNSDYRIFLHAIPTITTDRPHPFFRFQLQYYSVVPHCWVYSRFLLSWTHKKCAYHQSN